MTTEDPDKPETVSAELVVSSGEAPTFTDAESGVQVGDWYMVAHRGEERLMCVSALGSNYVQFSSSLLNCDLRIHHKEFFQKATPKPDAEPYIQAQIMHHQEEARRVAQEVQHLLTRVGVTPAGHLGGGSSMALALTSSVNVDSYKAALVKAESKEVPALHEEMQGHIKAMSKWAKMTVLPMQLRMGSLDPIRKAIQDRIFAVELYAGIGEQAVLIQDGKPANLEDKLHVFQRRLYMDEECLLHFENGGMRFDKIDDFHEWVCRPEHLHRILPYPRTVVVFRVRRYKEPVSGPFSLEFLFEQRYRNEQNERTYLYVRNGEKVYSIATQLEFGERLFPDLRSKEKRLFGYERFNEWKLVTKREAADIKKRDAWVKIHKFEPSSLYYDDMLEARRKMDEEHRRIVIILQGLLDRSEVLHPHVQASLWTDEGFSSVIELVYDQDMTLPEEAPFDLSSYLEELSGKIKKGTVVGGAQRYWHDHENKDLRGRERFWWAHGPRHDACTVLSMVNYRGEPHAVIHWLDMTKKGESDDTFRNKPAPRTMRVPVADLFNLTDYQPGILKRLLAHPTTRAEYAEYLQHFSMAESYHAGKVMAAPAKSRIDDELLTWEEHVKNRRWTYVWNTRPLRKGDMRSWRWSQLDPKDNRMPGDQPPCAAGKKWCLFGMDYDARTILLSDYEREQKRQNVRYFWAPMSAFSTTPPEKE